MLRALLAVLACLWLAGCNEPPPEEPPREPTPGVTEDTVYLGSSLALSGHAGYLGTQTLLGAQAYLKHVNENGGVHGRRIEVTSYDDAYDPPRCLLNTQKLIMEDKVFSLFCYVGTPTTVKIINLVDQAEIPLLGMFTGANALREPFNRYLINVRASYYQETAAAVRHFVEDLGIGSFAVFYQYDAYGFDGLTGTEKALAEYGMEPVARGSYVRGTLDVEEGLQRIRESGAEAVFLISTYDPAAKFIQMAHKQGYHPVFYGVSFVGARELARRLGPQFDNRLLMTQVVPPPEAAISQALLWGAKEYTDLLARYFPEEEPNFVGMEGYVNAKVMVEGLRRAGRDLTREGFIKALESIDNYSLGIANTLNFSATDHQGLERVYFTRLDDRRFVLISDWNRTAELVRAALPAQ
jgi:ABC-type branched-subunit amino acid transport system substrate-binding protein